MKIYKRLLIYIYINDYIYTYILYIIYIISYILYIYYVYKRLLIYTIYIY